MNFIVHQVAWFNGVIAAAHDRAALGSTVVAAADLSTSGTRRGAPELRLVVAALLAGLAWESLLVSLGLFRYGSGNFVASLAPTGSSRSGRSSPPPSTFLRLQGPRAARRHVRRDRRTAGVLEWRAARRARIANLMAALAGRFIYAMLVPALCALAQRWNGFAALPGRDRARCLRPAKPLRAAHGRSPAPRSADRRRTQRRVRCAVPEDAARSA